MGGAGFRGPTRNPSEGDHDRLARCKDRPRDLIHYGFGDLAKLAERSMLDAQLEHRPASRLAVEERMREIRRDLGVGTSPPLERRQGGEGVKGGEGSRAEKGFCPFSACIRAPFGQERGIFTLGHCF